MGLEHLEHVAAREVRLHHRGVRLLGGLHPAVGAAPGFFQRNAAQACVAPSGQKILQRLHGLSAVRPKRRVIAVVEDDDVASAHALQALE